MAVEFLSAHCDALRALAKFPGVETFIVGLQLNIEVTAGLLGFPISPSAQRMWHALHIGISPTFYVVLNRPGDPPPYEFSAELFLQGW